MQEVSFEPNRQGKLQLRHVGIEKTPVILIDDFATDTRPLIDYACHQVKYDPDGTSAYPGIRGRLPREYVVGVLNSIYRLLFKAYQVPATMKLKPVNSVYSLITTKEEQLQLSQRVPHYDSNEPFYLAILHYLADGSFCDTGLFRHRPTGYERITNDRLDSFLDHSMKFQTQHGEPPRAYIKQSNAHFELYERIEYRPNRLVVYPGNLLHSGLVNPQVDIDPDPSTGRLTANIFVNFAAAKEPNARV